MDLSVVELYAVGYALHILLGDVFVCPDMIYLLLDEFRMGELRGEIAVVGEEKHARGVAVESSYRIYPLAACVLDQIKHSETSVGIIAGGHAVFRLVEEHIAFALGSHDFLIIFHHIVSCDLGAELSHYLTIDFHETLCDVFIGFAA